MPRTKTFDIDEIEQRAMELFWLKGYEGTSIKDLTDHLGIGKGSLYSVYSGKRDLFLKSFSRYIRSIGMEALEPLRSGGDPQLRLRRVFETVALQITRDPLHRGCLMVNTITEMSGKDEVIEGAALAAREEVRQMFRRTLLIRREEADPAHAEAGSWILLNLFLGLRVLAKSSPTMAQVKPIIDAALRSIA
jgi:TetR/AcrR family transcriptional repressor of nem operon